jgi:hypothetical protein
MFSFRLLVMAAFRLLVVVQQLGSSTKEVRPIPEVELYASPARHAQIGIMQIRASVSQGFRAWPDPDHPFWRAVRRPSAQPGCRVSRRGLCRARTGYLCATLRMAGRLVGAAPLRRVHHPLDLDEAPAHPASLVARPA